MNADRIEKTIVLKSPRAKVWHAFTTPEQFGAWFGARLTGVFTPGTRVAGPITSKGYEHLTLEMNIERIEPQRLFSYRWHPYAIDPKVDYSTEPTTLCEFTLEDVPEGTRLTIVESGFEAIPAARRDEAFRMNSGGWAAQLVNIERHLADGGGAQA